MKRVTVSAIAAFSLFLVVTSAGAAGSLPTVLCKKPTVPGDLKVTDPGIYSYEPTICVLNYFRAPAPRAVFVPLRGMTWKRWDSKSAFGVGTVLTARIGIDGKREGWSRDPTKITLSRPRTVCGRTIFTAARILQIYGPFDEHTRLDRVPVEGRGCPG